MIARNNIFISSYLVFNIAKHFQKIMKITRRAEEVIHNKRYLELTTSSSFIDTTIDDNVKTEVTQ